MSKPEIIDVVKLFIFKSGEISLHAKECVEIGITKGEELWFAENEELDIYATGSDPDAAIKDFTLQLIHFYRHYMSLPDDRLLKHARKLKSIYSNNFVERMEG